MNEFLHMGGYALYVWGSYGATVAVLAWNAWAPRRERARLRQALSAERAA